MEFLDSEIESNHAVIRTAGILFMKYSIYFFYVSKYNVSWRFLGQFSVVCFRILIFELQLLFDGEHVSHQTADWCYLRSVHA